MSVFCIGVAALCGTLFLIGVARSLVGLRPTPDMRGVPITALEALGWVGVAVAGALGAGLGVLIAAFGAADLFDETARFILWAMLIVGITVWALAWLVIKRRTGAVVADERDRAILARSFSVESMMVLLSLVVWTVALTEAFNDDGAVPIGYLQLIFWTTLIGAAMGRSLGIVLGYRREIDVDA
jgi:hypothetical protein